MLALELDMTDEEALGVASSGAAAMALAKAKTAMSVDRIV